MTEDPILADYRKIQYEVLPSLADLAAREDVEKWCPASLQPFLNARGISHYMMLHLRAPTIEQPDAILVIFPTVQICGMDRCGLVIRNVAAENPPFFSYYALRYSEGLCMKIVKWRAGKFIAKCIGMDPGATNLHHWFVNKVLEMH